MTKRKAPVKLPLFPNIEAKEGLYIIVYRQHADDLDERVCTLDATITEDELAERVQYGRVYCELRDKSNGPPPLKLAKSEPIQLAKDKPEPAALPAQWLEELRYADEVVKRISATTENAIAASEARAEQYTSKVMEIMTSYMAISEKNQQNFALSIEQMNISARERERDLIESFLAQKKPADLSKLIKELAAGAVPFLPLIEIFYESKNNGSTLKAIGKAVSKLLEPDTLKEYLDGPLGDLLADKLLGDLPEGLVDLQGADVEQFPHEVKENVNSTD